SKDAQQQQLCYFYQRGNCRHGNQCRFLHARPPAPLAAAAESSVEGGPAVARVTISTVCWYLKRDGVCPHGDRCRFSHDLSSAVRQDSSKSSAKAQTLQACVFYQRGSCKRGQNCWYRHIDPAGAAPLAQSKTDAAAASAEEEKEEPTDKASSAAVKESGSGFVISRPAQTRQSPAAASAIPSMATKKSLSGLTEASAAELRQAEMATLIRRVPKSELLTRTFDNGEQVFEFDFQSSDPDWPYDVKSLPLAVAFPIGFPKEAMQVTVRESPQLPRRLLKTCQSGINKWLSERQTNCLKNDCACPVFRQFLRWLDRGLEDLFTTGLQLYKRELEAAQAGISIYTPEQLREKFAQAAAATAESKDSADVREDETEEADDNNDEDDSDEDSSDENEEGDSVQRPSQQQLRDPVRRGTEIALRRLELRDSVASLTVRRLVVELRCLRCRRKLAANLSADSKAGYVSMACAQCGSALRAGFRPSLLHSFSGNPAVVGFLDLTGCSAEDALLSAGDCEFVTVCLGCQLPHTHHGQLAGNGGQPMRHCCLRCHAWGGFVAEGVRLTVLSAPDVADGKSSGAAKQQQKKPKKPIEPDIRPGQPLPSNGTCRHYKRSYRWLRFPCCGRAFPCDICHDEAAPGDHEMAWAVRMLCGYCAKEQPVSDKCSSCGAGMSRARTSHWEGGRGCRDVKRMSRNEKKKYANLNKTVSRRAAAAGK
ncbi:hypothetical protein BOX15_Mlig002150g5, partial [Macrostomum lignano]